MITVYWTEKLIGLFCKWMNVCELPDCVLVISVLKVDCLQSNSSISAFLYFIEVTFPNIICIRNSLVNMTDIRLLNFTENYFTVVLL